MKNFITIKTSSISGGEHEEQRNLSRFYSLHISSPIDQCPTSIDSISRSAIDRPNCTHRSRNSGVVISRSVGRSFF